MDKGKIFRDLHASTFVMPNPWDGLSALIFKMAGFAALATSSGAFAATLGRRDGRHAVTAAEHLAHAKLLRPGEEQLVCVANLFLAFALSPGLVHVHAH